MRRFSLSFVLASLSIYSAVVGSACDPPTAGSASGAHKDAGAKLPDGGIAGEDASVPLGNYSKPQSCTGGPGADKRCGGVAGDDKVQGTQDCCDVAVVPGGVFQRFNDPAFPAKVSPFALDVFEVTVGRFRAWVEAADGDLRSSAPSEGAGAHPKIPNSGWRSEWNERLPQSRAEIDRMLGPEEGKSEGFMACQYGTNIDDEGALTWWTEKLDAGLKSRNKNRPDLLAANTKEALDQKPINCIPWHVLFAFCIWDGGRLPTEAEFDFAAAGGSEQRAFPWGAVDDGSLAFFDNRDDLSKSPTFEFGAAYVSARLYDKSLGENKYFKNYSFTFGGKAMGLTDNAAHIAPVGRKPLGNGRWGHADLAGGMFEWMLDEGPIRPGDCNDCANVNWPKGSDKDPNAYMEQPEFKNPGKIDWWQGGARAIRGSSWDNAVVMSNSQTKLEIEYYTSYPVLRTYRSIGGRCARDLK